MMDIYLSSVQKRRLNAKPTPQRKVIKEDLKTSTQKRMLKEALKSPVEDEIEPDMGGDFDPDPESPVGAIEDDPRIDLDAAEPEKPPTKSVDPASKEETLIAIVDKARESADDLMSLSGLAASPELDDWTTRAKIDALTKQVNRIHNKFNDELGGMGGEKGKEYLETEEKPEEDIKPKPEEHSKTGMKTEPLELEGVEFVAESITEDPNILESMESADKIDTLFNYVDKFIEEAANKQNQEDTLTKNGREMWLFYDGKKRGLIEFREFMAGYLGRDVDEGCRICGDTRENPEGWECPGCGSI